MIVIVLIAGFAGIALLLAGVTAFLGNSAAKHQTISRTLGQDFHGDNGHFGNCLQGDNSSFGRCLHDD